MTEETAVPQHGPGPQEPERPGRSLALNSSAIALSNVTRGGLAFVAAVVLTRVLSLSDRGAYSFFTNSTSLLVMLAGLGVSAALTRARARGTADLDELFRASWLLAVLIGLPVSGLFLGVFALTRQSLFAGTPWWQAATAAAVVPLLLLLSHWTVLAYLSDKIVEFAAAGFAASLLLLMGMTGLAQAGLLRADTAIALWSVTSLIPLVVLARRRRFRRPFATRRTAMDLLRFGIRANAASVALILAWRVDVLLVKGYLGLSELALYAAAVALGEILLMLTVSVRVALLPRQGDAENRDQLVETLATVTRLTVLLGLLATAGAFVLAEPVVQLLYGSRYAAAASALYWLVPGIAALVLQGPLIDYLLAEDKVPGVTVATLTALVLNVMLNVALLPRVGFVGAAMASVAAYSVSAGACILMYARATRTPLRQMLLVRRGDLGQLRGRRAR